MGRHDPGLVRDAELAEHVGGVLHRGPVAVRAHDDADLCTHDGFLRGPAARRRRSPTASPSPTAGGNAAITTSIPAAARSPSAAYSARAIPARSSGSGNGCAASAGHAANAA